MAVGRDAADVALMTTFGAHTLDKFVVVTDEIPDDQPDATEAAWNGLTPDNSNRDTACGKITGGEA
jgi:hypothetical protein